MQLDDVAERIRQITRERLHFPASSDGAGGKSGLHLDSMAFLEVLVAVEDEFGISLVDEELALEQGVEPLHDLARLVLEKISEPAVSGAAHD